MRTVMLLGCDERRVIYRLLLQHAGYRVVEAAGIEEAVRLLLQERPQVVVVDVSQADEWRGAVSGGAARAARLPLIVLEPASGVARTRGGARNEHRLSKPCSARRLLTEVDRTLEAPPRREPLQATPIGPSLPRASVISAEPVWRSERMRETWGGLRRE